MEDLSEEEWAKLRCNNPQCGKPLRDVGVEQVTTALRKAIHFTIYRGGVLENSDNHYEATTATVTGYACGYCRYWLDRETGEMFVVLLERGGWYLPGRVPQHQMACGLSS